MPDGILSIGAAFEKAQLEGDFTDATAMVKAATEGWSTAFESSKKATRDAAAAMADSVRTFAQNVRVSAVEAAEALKEQAIAQNEVRMATRLARDETVPATVSTLAMASAQERLAAASSAAALKVKAMAAEIAEDAVPAASAWERASLAIRESLATVQEKLVETAETGKLSGEGMASGFAGLGSLLGVGIAAGFATHFMDEVAKANVELGHLSVMSGMAVGSLAGLRQIVREMGGDWDPIATGLVKMDKALADSAAPSKQLQAALGGVGLSIKDLKGLSPEDQLQKIAIAFAGTANAGNLANAAIAIFGRGGRALIPILKEQGAELNSNIQKQSELTGVTEKSVAAAREWTRNMADVTVQLQRLGNAVIASLHYVEAVGAGLGTVLDAIAMSFYVAFNHAREGIAGLGKELYDVLSGNWRDIGKDWDATMSAMIATAAKAKDEVASRWKDTKDLWKGSTAAMDSSAGSGVDDGSGADVGDAGSDGGSAGRVGREKPFKQYGPPNLFAMDQNTAAAGSAAVGAAADQQAIAQNSAAWDAYYKHIEGDANAMADMQKRIASANASADAQQQAAGVAAWARYYQSISDAAAKAAQQQEQAFQRMFSAITGPMNTFFDHWLTNGHRMGAAFQKMYDQIAMNFINAEIKMLEKHLQMEIQKRVVTEASNAQQVASTASAAAVTTAINTQTAMQSISQKAADAAAGAWNALSNIPIVGPALGAAAAAATYVGIMALAAFEQGGVVDGPRGYGVPILAHAGERVLSQSQTTNFERMVNQSTSNSSSKEVHFHDHSNWSGVDGASVEGMFRKHAASGRREMMRQLRLANVI